MALGRLGTAPLRRADWPQIRPRHLRDEPRKSGDVGLRGQPDRHGLIDLIPRLFYLVNTSQFKRTMDVLLLQSRIDNSRIHVLAIPENEDLPFSLDFSNREIKDIFRLGIKTGQNNSAWTALPAGGLPAYWAPSGMTMQDTGTAGKGG